MFRLKVFLSIINKEKKADQSYTDEKPPYKAERSLFEICKDRQRDNVQTYDSRCKQNKRSFSLCAKSQHNIKLRKSKYKQRAVIKRIFA